MTASPAFLSALAEELRASTTQLLEAADETDREQALTRIADLWDIRHRSLEQPGAPGPR